MNIINLNLNANRSLTQQKVGGLLVMSIVGEAIILPGLRNEMSKILNAVDPRGDSGVDPQTTLTKLTSICFLQ